TCRGVCLSELVNVVFEQVTSFLVVAEQPEAGRRGGEQAYFPCVGMAVSESYGFFHVLDEKCLRQHRCGFSLSAQRFPDASASGGEQDECFDLAVGQTLPKSGKIQVAIVSPQQDCLHVRAEGLEMGNRSLRHGGNRGVIERDSAVGSYQF